MPDEVRRRILYRKIKLWTVIYESSRGTRIKITTPYKPLRTKVLREAGGNRKFKAVSVSTEYREVLIVGKSAKKGKKAEVEDQELEQLEELADLEEVEADPEVEEEKPKKKKGKKNKVSAEDADEPKKKGASKGRRVTEGKIGTAEMAERCEVTSRDLRMMLRKAAAKGEEWAQKDEETGRYEWDPDSKLAKAVEKAVRAGGVKEAKQESLDRLKETQEAKKKSKKDKKKKSKKSE